LGKFETKGDTRGGGVGKALTRKPHEGFRKLIAYKAAGVRTSFVGPR